MSRPHLPVWLRGSFLILSLIGIGLLLKGAGLEHLFERAWIDANVRGNGLHGYGLFLAAGMLMTAVGLPRQVVAFFGGYAFGVMAGLLLGALAALGGCILSFYYARLFGRSLVRRMFPDKLQRFDEFISGHPFSMTLLVRLLPVGSNLVTNLIAGVSRIPKLAFFGGSLVGYLPQTLVFALAGSGLTVGSQWQIGVSVILLIVSGLLGVRLYRRMRHGRSFARELETASDPE
ncbi:MAG: VTT domain-containing protein [Pseudomonadota bacterium]